MNENLLFDGEAQAFGGLSNEDELVSVCPLEFKDKSNPWNDYVSRLFYQGGRIDNWQWKLQEKMAKQLEFFYALLRSRNLVQKDKIAVAAWMLSEMLTSAPVHKESTN